MIKKLNIMKNLFYLLFLFVIFNTNNFAQESKKINYNNLLIVEYQLSGIQNKGQAELITSELIKSDNNLFCFADLEKMKLFILSKKVEEIDLSIRESKISLLTSRIYSDKEFLELYIKKGMQSNKVDNNLDLPNYINTGNSFKDDLNYYHVKEIYIKKNKENYNKIK